MFFLTFKFIFDKLALLFHNMLWIVFESIPEKKTLSEEQKTWYFLILHFGRQANGEGGKLYSPSPRHDTGANHTFPIYLILFIALSKYSDLLKRWKQFKIV